MYNSNNDNERRCPMCGSRVGRYDKVCSECGAPLPPVKEQDPFDIQPKQRLDIFGYPVRGNEKTDDDIYANRSAKQPRQDLDIFGYPVRGGEKSEADVFGRDDKVIPFQRTEAPPDAETLKLRRIVMLLIVLSGAFSAVGVFASLCAPFLSVTYTTGGSVETYSVRGIALIVGMFGIPDSLIYAGVPFDLIRYTGWVAMLVAVGCIGAFVATAVSVSSCMRTKPFAPWAPALMPFLASMAFMILGIVAKSKAVAAAPENATVSTSLGGISVFVFATAGLVAGIIATAARSRAYTASAKGGVMLRASALACALVALGGALTLLIPVLDVDYTERYSVKPNTKGRAAVLIDEKMEDGEAYYIGMTVFDLAELNDGNTYAFTIYTNSYIEPKLMKSVISLVYADGIDTGKAEELYYINVLEYNQTAATAMAKIVIDYNAEKYAAPLALAVNFSSRYMTNVKFEWELERV